MPDGSMAAFGHMPNDQESILTRLHKPTILQMILINIHLGNTSKFQTYQMRMFYHESIPIKYNLIAVLRQTRR